TGSGKYLFLIDEAHNLVDRAREMYSAVLVKEDVLAAKKLFPDDKGVVRKLESLNRVMLELKRECEGETVFEPETVPSALIYQADRLREAISSYLERHRLREEAEEKRTFFFKLYTFLETFDAMGQGYLPYASFDEEGRFFVKLFCIDPAERLKERLEEARSAIFFSATLLPVNYYKSLLTGNQDENAVYLDSPFDPENRRILVFRDVSSKYTRRNDAEFEKIAFCLHAFAKEKTGHYLAFFPSYKFLESVSEKMEALPDDIRILKQRQGMTEEERLTFLREFTGEDSGDRSLIGLTVSGGIFSEGIDLKGDALIGVAVVGTGLPLVSRERELMKRYFDSVGGSGFDFAYRFPGFNKVMQAAGRLIRTMDDRGVILLMDERFLQSGNRALFPREWASFETVRSDSFCGPVREFWSRSGIGENTPET
ncbi:MAG: ATP-dependent DNA helicase, partial [Lachnospiraceae bacterium]|nr:ATP-dependent DNA helicase [Lachnospiraceae bacterium]